MMEHCPLTGKPCFNKKTVHITEIVDGVASSLDLCEECAAFYFEKTNLKKPPAEPEPEPKTSPFPSPSMAKEMIQLFEYIVQGVANRQQVRTCPNCKWTLEDVKTYGKLGCPKCYEYFEKLIPMVLMNHHKALKHTGKVPKSFQKKGKPLLQQIAEAEAQMKEAIQEEDYERASALRDEIVALKGQLPGD